MAVDLSPGYQCVDRSQQLPVADIMVIDVFRIAVEDTGADRCEVLVQELHFLVQYPGAAQQPLWPMCGPAEATRRAIGSLGLIPNQSRRFRERA